MKQLAEKPFVLLGVNSDPDREDVKQLLTDEEITWRSWWDEGHVDGPIQTTWQVEQRPTIYLLDAEGTIRYKNIQPEDLDVAIAGLLKELSGENSDGVNAE